MTVIGTMRLAWELGRTPSTPKRLYQYLACAACNRARWVEIVGGQPRHIACCKGDDVTVNHGRVRAIKLYPGRRPCVICRRPGERHHRDGNTVNNNKANITWLCRTHHMALDGRLGNRDRSGRFKRQAEGYESMPKWVDN